MTRPLSPAELLAEVPVVSTAKRLTRAFHELSLVVEHSLVSDMAGDDALESAQCLRYWLDVQIEAALAQRADDGRGPVVWEPPCEMSRSLGESRG